MLADFWSPYARPQPHPLDAPLLNTANTLTWTLNQANANAATFEFNKSLHQKLHISLYPQPFIGNLESARVFILFGNPGCAISDYADEMSNHPHAQACSLNLTQVGTGFFPLLPQSAGTGVARYWTSRLNSLVSELASLLSISIAKARSIVVDKLSLIESGAYHSKKFPGHWCDELPSSLAVREFVQKTLAPRAQTGEILLFVWRRASFWDLPIGNRGVLMRPPEKAQLKNITQPERTRIANFLAECTKTDA